MPYEGPKGDMVTLRFIVESLVGQVLHRIEDDFCSAPPSRLAALYARCFELEGGSFQSRSQGIIIVVQSRILRLP